MSSLGSSLAARIVARVRRACSANLWPVTKPLLEAARLRVDEGGVPQIDGLSLETTGDRVLVLAGPTVLFHACAGMVSPRHGTVLVGGVAPVEALRLRLLASAPLDPPLPLGWKAREYVAWSARLAGHSRSEAITRADDAIARLKVEALADARLRFVPLHARRALGVAAALATGATTLFLEDPLRNLVDEPARNLARLILRSTAGLRTVIFAARAPLASPLAIDADEALVIDGSSVVAQGAPAEVAARDRSYAVRLNATAGADAFARLAEKRGARITGQGTSWTVDLGESLKPNDLLDFASACDSVVVELRPLAHAFS
jgi:ABC-2 type transport system ATP-binding protein